MGNNSTLLCAIRRFMPGLFAGGLLGLSWGVLGGAATVPAASTATLEVEQLEFTPTPEITLAQAQPESIPAAPGGVAMVSQRDGLAAGAGRSSLQVYCSPSSFRLIAAALERGFEISRPDIDLVLHIDTDRNCVGHLLMGTADTAMIGSDLSQRERRAELLAQTLGHQIMVPVVHLDNPVNSVCYDDFRAMLNGSLTGWSRVGGQRLRIEPVCEAPPTRRDLAADVLRFADQAAGSTVFMHSHAEIIGYVSNNPRGLGLVSKTSADSVRIIKILRVDEVLPTRKALRQGAWRFGSTFRAIHAKEPHAEVEAWLEYLSSDAARQVIGRVMTLPRLRAGLRK